MQGNMTILKTKPEAILDNDHTLNRVFPVTAKLTKEERENVTEFARSQGLARGEWIRDAILKEMRGESHHVSIPRVQVPETWQS